MKKYDKGEIRVTEEFKDTWKKFLAIMKEKKIPSISAGLRWAVQEATREKDPSLRLSEFHGKFLLQLPFTEFKIGDERNCIICGKDSRVVVQSPHGKYGLCEAAWNSICDLEEKDV